MANVQQSLFFKLYPCQNGKFVLTKQLKAQLHRHTRAVPGIFLKEQGTNFLFPTHRPLQRTPYILMLPKIQKPSNEVFFLHPILIQMHTLNSPIAELSSTIKYKFLLQLIFFIVLSSSFSFSVFLSVISRHLGKTSCRQ